MYSLKNNKLPRLHLKLNKYQNNKINELVQAVKQLDRKIREER